MNNAAARAIHIDKADTTIEKGRKPEISFELIIYTARERIIAMIWELKRRAKKVLFKLTP